MMDCTIRTMIITVLVGTACASFSQQRRNPKQSKSPSSYCNPLDLNYRYYTRKKTAYREAADPVVVIYRGEYYLFSSKTLGYWHSKTMADWDFIPCTEAQLPNIDQVGTNNHGL